MYTLRPSPLSDSFPHPPDPHLPSFSTSPWCSTLPPPPRAVYTVRPPLQLLPPVYTVRPPLPHPSIQSDFPSPHPSIQSGLPSPSPHTVRPSLQPPPVYTVRPPLPPPVYTVRPSVPLPWPSQHNTHCRRLLLLFPVLGKSVSQDGLKLPSKSTVRPGHLVYPGKRNRSSLWVERAAAITRLGGSRPYLLGPDFCRSKSRYGPSPQLPRHILIPPQFIAHNWHSKIL